MQYFELADSSYLVSGKIDTLLGYNLLNTASKWYNILGDGHSSK